VQIRANFHSNYIFKCGFTIYSISQQMQNYSCSIIIPMCKSYSMGSQRKM